MAKKRKKEDDLFGTIPPPEEFNAFPSAFPDDIISTLTTPNIKEDTPKSDDKETRQKDMSNDNIICHNQMTSPNDVTKWHDPVTWQIEEPPLLKTKNQRKLFNYLKRHGSMVTTIGTIAKKTGISTRTVQRILTLFEDVGYIVKEKFMDGDIQGIKITVLDRMKNKDSVNTQKKSQHSGGKQHLSDTSSQIDKEEISQPDDPEEETEKRLLALTEDDIKFFFPCLSAKGFGTQQIKQIVNSLKKIGKSCKHIIKSLEHAEWELANDCMVDKVGNKVDDPCGYVFISLAREGYYRRPKGYISPEEQAIKDEQEEAKRKLKALKEKEEIEFELWKKKLSPQELKEILKNKKGPEDQWLKHIFYQQRQNS